MYRFIYYIIIAVCISSLGFSAIIQVPADQPTIQDGIIAAVPGDVVLVAEGTYYENINFMGKAITVASKFYLDGRKKHIKKTILNGSRPADPDFGSVVNFVSGEDTNSVLCGFTITGGSGTVQVFPGFPPMRSGGGILCFASGAKIIHNRIIDNTIDNAGWAMGGGYANGPPMIPTTSILEDNIIERNSVTGQVMATGGGITFNSAGRVVNNTIRHNQAYSFGVGSNGGGIALSSWGVPPNPIFHEVLVHGNDISHNKALQPETALPGISSHAGGLTIIGSKGEISNNKIMFNEICPFDSGFGAGVVLDYPPEDLVFKNNIVAHNYFTGTGECYGGGIAIWDGSPILMNNLIEKNRGTIGGALWTGLHFCNAKIINNTITKNEASKQGGAINAYGSNLTVMNSILWKNIAPEGCEIFVESGVVNVSYSDVAGGWDGTGNLDVNPRLISMLQFLGFKSPCIDAGNPDEMYNDPESRFRSGYAQLPARGTIRNDMGAYGGPAAADWWNFFNFKKEAEAFDSEAPEVIAGNSPDKISITCFPNPFNSQTSFQFELPEAGIVSLKIYNVLGQQVAILVDGTVNAGSHRYVWNAEKLASGVYFYRLVTKSTVHQNRLILMK